MINKVLVKAKDFTGLTGKVKCSNGTKKSPRWHIIAIQGPWFVVECSNGDTFLATQMYVNEEEVK